MSELQLRKPTLLEVAEEVTVFADTLDAIDGSDAPEEQKQRQRDELAESMRPQLETAVKKVDAFGASWKRLDAEIAFLKAEEKAIRDRRKSRELALERIKQYALFVLDAVPGKMLKGKGRTLRVWDNSVSSVLPANGDEWTPEAIAKLPPELVLVTIEMSLKMLMDLKGNFPLTFRSVRDDRRRPNLSEIQDRIERQEEVPARLVRGKHVRCT